MNGKREAEDASLTKRALHPNLAAMALDDALGDVEAEPNASTIALVDLNVSLEDCVQLIQGNSEGMPRSPLKS